MKKKLKTKHFRYLSKGYRKNPNRFLKEVVQQWGVNWSNNINHLVNSCIYPPMRTSYFDYGFMHLHLGQMIEVAYIIFKECQLEPADEEQVFAFHCKSVFSAEIEDEIIFPEKKLRSFFGFKSLREWYAVLDDLTVNRDLRDHVAAAECFEGGGLAIRELLVELPRVLMEIHQRGGLQHALPERAGL